MDEGVATAEQIVDALDQQMARTPPFGKLALGRKLLSIAQIWRILNHQADQGGRFGEIAITLGYLTETQVKELLLLQLESRPKLGEVLVERDVLQQEQLQQLLDRYHARRLADALGPVPEAEVEEWPADATSHARVLAASATKEATG